MDAVHVGRDDKEAQHAVGRPGQVDVGVIEERGRVQHDLEQQHRDGRRAKGSDDGKLDAHRDHDLGRMKAQAGRGVEVEIGVVHAVQPPEPRHRMEHHMLEVDREVEQQHREHEGDPDRQLEVVEEPPAALLGHDRKPHAEDRKCQPQDHGVERDEREVV